MNYDHIIHHASPAAARASSSSLIFPFSLCIFVEAEKKMMCWWILFYCLSIAFAICFIIPLILFPFSLNWDHF